MKDPFAEWFSEKDSGKPYRLVCPRFSLAVQRFETEKEANTAFEYCKTLGHQSILSKIDINTKRTKIIRFSSKSNPTFY